MRVSGGHLCEAEAPTEPTGETADPYKIITDNRNDCPSFLFCYEIFNLVDVFQTLLIAHLINYFKFICIFFN